MEENNLNAQAKKKTCKKTKQKKTHRYYQNLVHCLNDQVVFDRDTFESIDLS